MKKPPEGGFPCALRALSLCPSLRDPRHRHRADRAGRDPKWASARSHGMRCGARIASLGDYNLYRDPVGNCAAIFCKHLVDSRSWWEADVPCEIRVEVATCCNALILAGVEWLAIWRRRLWTGVVIDHRPLEGFASLHIDCDKRQWLARGYRCDIQRVKAANWNCTWFFAAARGMNCTRRCLN